LANIYYPALDDAYALTQFHDRSTEATPRRLVPEQAAFAQLLERVVQSADGVAGSGGEVTLGTVVAIVDGAEQSTLLL
jgi:hypothetical protein